MLYKLKNKGVTTKDSILIISGGNEMEYSDISTQHNGYTIMLTEY